MMPLYIFCACLGIPLLALFAFGGGDGEAELDSAGFDVDGDLDAGTDIDVGADTDLGGVGDFTAFWRRVPVSSYMFFLSFFGTGGILGNLFGLGFAATLTLAIIAGLVSGFVNTALFSFLRNTEYDSRLTDSQIEGRLATVSVPIELGKRGRVWIDTGEERVQLTAGSVDDLGDVSFQRGEEVVIVSMDNGVAKVMAVDPELSD